MRVADVAFLSVFLAGFAMALVPIALGRLRDRAGGALRAWWQIVAWGWFAVLAVGHATVWAGMLRVLAGEAAARLARDPAAIVATLDLACIAAWALLAVGGGWVARRAVYAP